MTLSADNGSWPIIRTLENRLGLMLWNIEFSSKNLLYSVERIDEFTQFTNFAVTKLNKMYR